MKFSDRKMLLYSAAKKPKKWTENLIAEFFLEKLCASQSISFLKIYRSRCSPYGGNEKLQIFPSTFFFITDSRNLLVSSNSNLFTSTISIRVYIKKAKAITSFQFPSVSLTGLKKVKTFKVIFV